MKVTTLLIIISIVGLLVPVSLAQETTGDGQICVRAFEDRNSNGTFDANEPPITQGIGVNLLNIQSITIGAQLLEDSESAALGTVCFRELLAGDYTIIVTSADYTATTPTTFNAVVVPQSVPTRLDFGGTIITTSTTTGTVAPTITEDDQNRALQGILFGAIGAIVVMFVMFIAGIFIYFATFRRRMNRAMSQSTGGYRPITGPMPVYQQHGTGPMQPVRPDTAGFAPVRPATDSMRPVRPTTGSMPAVQEPPNPLLNRNPNEGSPPLFSDEDTDQMGSI